MVVVGILFHGVDRHLSVKHVESHQSGAHGGNPHVAIAGCGQSEHVGVVALSEIGLMPLERYGVYPSAALTERGEPDVAFLVLSQTEDGTGAVDDMFCRQVASVEQVEPVLVGAYPQPSVTVDESAGDTVGADDVLSAQSVSHVSEVHLCHRLHEKAFLQEANPDVAVAVLKYRHGLALVHVQVAAVEGIVGKLARHRVVDDDSLSVASEQQASVAGGAQRVDRQAGSLCNMLKLALVVVVLVDTLAVDSHIDIAFAVLPYLAEHRTMVRILEEQGVVVGLNEHDAIVLGNQP